MVRLLDLNLLIALIHHGGKLATLDQSIAHLLPSDSPHRDVLETVPVT